MQFEKEPSATKKPLELKINEIFFSIQGESSLVGHPTVFVRTSGCPLRCTYCDTTYAYYEGEKQTLTEILETVRSHGTRYVCITGGEPLVQKPVYKLMEMLCDEGFYVSLETSGAVDCKDVDPRVRKIIDVKTPDSGAPETFRSENLAFADVNTEFKFVICSEADFYWAELFCKQHDLFAKSHVLYSPSYKIISPKFLAKKILFEKSQARLQLQLHKYIWIDSERGV